MKAHAMNIRTKSKDAYDIWFCLANYPEDLKRIAQSIKPHINKVSVKAALAILSKNFKSIEDRGPLDVVKEDGSSDLEYRQFLQQDSFQRVHALLTYLEIV